MEYTDDSTRASRAQRFAEMHAQARSKANKSQEYMAMELGVSKKTIQNWEKGISSPTFFQSLEWFRILKVNPLPLYIQCVFPYKNARGKQSDPDEVIEERFQMLTEQFSITTKRAFVFLYFGEHGSSPTAVLQIMMAYLHCKMKSRVMISRLVAEAYKLEKEMGTFVCPENILPDIDLLDKSIDRARHSVKENVQTYDPIDS